MVVRCNSMGFLGMESYEVKIEADVSVGMPAFDMVGLPDAAVKESRDRVRTAMKNCGFRFPQTRIIINLAPADIRKEGPIYDLPILVALLKATGQLNADTDDCVFMGEISLSGDVRPINGVLPMVIKAQQQGIKNAFVPFDNGAEGAVVDGINVYPVKNIIELFEHLTENLNIQTIALKKETIIKNDILADFSQVKGQFEVKRALEVAAAGGHNILLIGPPGTGKSMLAKRIPYILPDMTSEETIETTKIHSIAGILHKGEPLITQRPFRSPHHTVSPAGLSGGGATPRPGEISLAHNGVLFLDELPEFKRSTIEVLRQPIEEGLVSISRVFGTLTYPCKIMFVAAMNPCPCGYFNHPTKKCTCSEQTIKRYLNKISGPLLDRFDIHVEVPPVEYDELSSCEPSESSAQIKQRVNKARQIQNERFKTSKTTCNAHITAAQFHTYCAIDDTANMMLKKAFEKMGLSARAYDRILKVARTIADLDSSENIKTSHIAEAVQYRSLDRKYWGNE